MADDIKKTIIRDKLGRKVKTNHFTQSGALDYTNAYFYDGNSTLPTEGLQTYFNADEKPIRIINNQLSEDKKHFIMTRDTWYNKDGSLLSVTDYNLDGKKTKEKKFYKDKNGFTCYHRKHFDPMTEKETLSQDMVRFSVGDIVITPEVEKMMKEYNIHCGFEKENTKTPERKGLLSKIALLKTKFKNH